MAPKFKKGDRVKAYATRFDKADTDLEEGEELFSAKWAADGNGIWCYGAVTRVYVKKGRHPQEYMIRYDNGESMRGMEEHLVAAEDDGESEIASEEERDNMDRDSNNCSTDLELDANIRAQRQDNDREVTDDEAGEVAEGEEAEMGVVTDIGETVIKGKDDDPNKKSWTRIAAMPTSARTEEWEHTTFQNLTIRDDTTELDIFLALLPLSPESLLQIVRDGEKRANSRMNWKLEDILFHLLHFIWCGSVQNGNRPLECAEKRHDAGPGFWLVHVSLALRKGDALLGIWA